MKRFCYLLSGVIASFLIAIMASSSSASALSFSGQNLIPILAGSSFVYASDGSRLTLVSNSGTPSGATATFTGAMLNKWATRVTLKFNGKRTVTHSLVSVSGRFCGGVNSDAFVSLEPDQYYSIVWSTISSGTDKCTNFNYVFYTDGSHDNINLQGRLFWVNTDSTVDFNPISMTTLDREPTRDQLVEIHNRLNIVNGNLDSIEGKLDTTNSTLNSIKNTLSGLNIQGVIDSQNKTTTAVTNAANQAHKDSQAQLEFDKQQAEKEEQQRQEDEKKAQDSGDQSQSDADQAQSDVDNASASLFSVINSVKDVILQGSNTGDCSISGDFGFFNVGTVNLCTGGDKIRPITSVVGSVMLIFFTFMAALSLINKFKDLYCEYMGYK